VHLACLDDPDNPQIYTASRGPSPTAGLLVFDVTLMQLDPGLTALRSGHGLAPPLRVGVFRLIPARRNFRAKSLSAARSFIYKFNTKRQARTKVKLKLQSNSREDISDRHGFH